MQLLITSNLPPAVCVVLISTGPLDTDEANEMSLERGKGLAVPLSSLVQ